MAGGGGGARNNAGLLQDTAVIFCPPPPPLASLDGTPDSRGDVDTGPGHFAWVGRWACELAGSASSAKRMLPKAKIRRKIRRGSQPKINIPAKDRPLVTLRFARAARKVARGVHEL